MFGKISLAFLLASFSLFMGCASTSGIGTVGQDTYLISRQAATGFGGLGTLKVEAINEAEAHCKSMSKIIRVIDTTDSQPPYLLGNFPRTEIIFMCI